VTRGVDQKVAQVIPSLGAGRQLWDSRWPVDLRRFILGASWKGETVVCPERSLRASSRDDRQDAKTSPAVVQLDRHRARLAGRRATRGEVVRRWLC